MSTTNLNTQIDVDQKRIEEIFNEMEFNMSAVLTVFLRQTVRPNGLHFDMRLDAAQCGNDGGN